MDGPHKIFATTFLTSTGNRWIQCFCHSFSDFLALISTDVPIHICWARLSWLVATVTYYKTYTSTTIVNGKSISFFVGTFIVPHSKHNFGCAISVITIIHFSFVRLMQWNSSLFICWIEDAVGMAFSFSNRFSYNI